MDGIHDMGGMHGFGPIDIEKDEPVFHAPWEGRVLAICRKLKIPVPGGMRNNIEQMPPAEYLRSSYYEKWLHARTKGLLEAGVISAAELAEKVAQYSADPEAPLPAGGQSAQPVPTVANPISIWSGTDGDGPVTAAHFNVGDQVRAKKIHPQGHTRLPRYIRGKRGQIVKIYRHQAPQEAQPFDGDGPQAVYAVQFAAAEVWGASAEPNSYVLLDMWESYLEKA